MTNNYLSKQIVLIAFLLFSGLAIETYAQFPSKVITATQKADTKTLSNYFNSKIELELPNKSGVFCATQAKLIIADFFKKNPPNRFNIIHQGNREHSSFAIGEYISNKKKFRFYFLTKSLNNRVLIYQLRIEIEDD